MPAFVVNETKTIQTKNNSAMVDAMNERYAHFFWNVKSIQVTHVKDSHLEFRENLYDQVEISSVTETTEYATIVYERNKLIPHYAEVTALEQECEKVEEEIRKEQNRLELSREKSEIIKTVLYSIPLFWVVGIIIVSFGSGVKWLEWIGSLLFLAPFGLVPFGIWRAIADKVDKKKMASEARAALGDRLLPERDRILNEMVILARQIMAEMQRM